MNTANVAASRVGPGRIFVCGGLVEMGSSFEKIHLLVNMFLHGG